MGLLRSRAVVTSLFAASYVAIFVLAGVPTAAVVGTDSYGELRRGIIATYQDGMIQRTAAGDPVRSKSVVFGSASPSAGDYGTTGWSVAATNLYMPNKSPIGVETYVDTVSTETYNETAEDGTVTTYSKKGEKQYLFYEWEVFCDVYFRTLADVKKVQLPSTTVTAWELEYDYKTPLESFCDGWDTKKYYQSGTLTYTPWAIYTGAGPVELSVDLLFEVTPVTFGAGVETGDGFTYNGAWAGWIGSEIKDYQSGFVPNMPSSAPTEVQGSISKDSGVVTGSPTENSGTADQAYESIYTGIGSTSSRTSRTSFSGGGTTSVSEVLDPSLVAEVQGHYATRSSLNADMYPTDETTSLKNRIFSPDLELTDAPAKVRVPLTQRLAPQVMMYRNSLTYNYYRYNVTEQNGDTSWYAVCNKGDSINAIGTAGDKKTITYDRSAVVNNVYAKYTLRMRYVQITDWTKYTAVPIAVWDPDTGEVNETAYDDPYGIDLEPGLGVDDLTDDQSNDTSGGVATVIDNPPPPVIIQTTQTGQDSVTDGFLSGLLGDDWMTYVWIAAGVVAAVVVVCFVLRLRSAKAVSQGFVR